MARAPRLAFALAAAGLLAGPIDALALDNGRFTPFVDAKVGYDDNVFRISQDLVPSAAIGSSSKADIYRRTSLGFDLDLALSRQRLRAGVAWDDTRYQRFTDASFTGRDLHATWLWRLGDRLSGRLGHTETTALASFAFIQARTPDVLDTRQTFWDAKYLLAARWQAEAGLSRIEQTNRDPAHRASDIRIVGGESTLSYVSRAHNSIGLRVHAEDGRFPNPEPVGGALVDNAYRQTGADLVADWTLSGASHLSGRIGRVSRRYVQLPQRDFAGDTARAEYQWKPTGKLSLNAIVERDLSAYEDIRSNFVLVKGITLRPILRLSDKIELAGTLESSVLDYLGDPGVAPGAAAGRQDRVHAAGLSLSYRPTRAATLQFSVRRERRSSNVPLADYDADTAFASVRIAF